MAIARYLSEGSVDVAERAAAMDNVSVFPNPAHDVVLVSYTQRTADPVRMELLNTVGQLVAAPVMDGVHGQGRQYGTLSLPQGLPAGAYFLRLSDATGARTACVIVQ
ncbi:MAG: T9SS type A sorting domain-containing protein [Flavobacteriales bacterium]